MKPYYYIKTLLGYILAAFMTLVLSPLLLGIALSIKLDSPGPVLFRQKRIAQNNKEFFIYKFRSMRVDTPKDMPTHLFQNAESFITRTGAFLRKTSLDELPQLINILKGDMAFVGPRPALWNQYDLIALRTELGADKVKPGITGWAQINGRDEIPIEQKATLDGYYASHYSLTLDIKILLLTVVKVLRKEGIQEGGSPRESTDEGEN